MTEIARAKLFMHGRSQAVRLPKEFRMPGTEVTVFRDGENVVLKPVRNTKPSAAEIFAALDKYGDLPFMEEGREQPPYRAPVDIDFD